VECETDRLSGGRVQTKLRAVDRDPRADKIRKMRKLGAYQILHISSPLLVPTQQVLVGCERLDALSESSNKVLRTANRGLSSDGLYEAEQILDTMVCLPHQQLNVLFMSFPLGQILHHGNK
jgi:hypothetical protein